MEVYHENFDAVRGDHRDRDYWAPARCTCPRHAAQVAWQARPGGGAPSFEGEDGETAPFHIIWRGGLPESELWHHHACDCGRETDCEDVRCLEPPRAVCDDCAGAAR